MYNTISYTSYNIIVSCMQYIIRINNYSPCLFGLSVELESWFVFLFDFNPRLFNALHLLFFFHFPILPRPPSRAAIEGELFARGRLRSYPQKA